MNDLAIDWEGKYSPYDRPEDWLPEVEKRGLSPWILGQRILASHNERRFRTRAVQETVRVGSGIRLRIEGVTSLAPLAILHGRLNEEPLDLFGGVVVSYEEELDALINLSPEASPGTYIFLAQQWEPGGASIYASSAASVEVRPHIDDETFWNSFEPWPEDVAEEVRENIRQARKRI
ncbi:MAG: hypothetical protein ACRDSJ_25735 [Rubrobacteraceae bacterium]